MNRIKLLTALALMFTTFSTVAALDTVYVASNQSTGNILHSYILTERGELTKPMLIPTGGVGTDSGLGNQGGIAIQYGRGEKYLAVVNAGSNDFSLFKLEVPKYRRAIFSDKISSMGIKPVSVSIYKQFIYVLNAGDETSPSSVSLFKIVPGGKLEFVSGAITPLSTALTGPAQVSVSHDGKLLAVTEKATDSIVTFQINSETGILFNKVVTSSSGMTPFGFAWTKQNSLVVSEAFGGNDSALSEYSVSNTGVLVGKSLSVDANDEKAACWVDLSEDQSYAYITNTATNTISRYSRSKAGMLKLEQAKDLKTENGPIDLFIAKDGKFGAVLNNSGSIQSFRVKRSDGSLSLRDTIKGLPVSANGLVMD